MIMSLLRNEPTTPAWYSYFFTSGSCKDSDFDVDGLSLMTRRNNFISLDELSQMFQDVLGTEMSLCLCGMSVHVR